MPGGWEAANVSRDGSAPQVIQSRLVTCWNNPATSSAGRRHCRNYGMNFEHMPELKWAYGHFLVIGVIVAICATLYVQFRRHGWL